MSFMNALKKREPKLPLRSRRRTMVGEVFHVMTWKDICGVLDPMTRGMFLQNRCIIYPSHLCRKYFKRQFLCWSVLLMEDLYHPIVPLDWFQWNAQRSPESFGQV